MRPCSLFWSSGTSGTDWHDRTHRNDGVDRDDRCSRNCDNDRTHGMDGDDRSERSDGSNGKWR